MHRQATRDGRPSRPARHTRRRHGARPVEQARGYAGDVASTPEMRPVELAERLTRLEAQVREMQEDLAAIAAALKAHGAEVEAEALAAERIRSGAAQRTVDGAEALAELGISAG